MMNNATVYGITSYHARYFANEISCRPVAVAPMRTVCRNRYLMRKLI